ncbi:MAG: FAD-dependent oxidoreductase [Lachnospiraceae bacterium]|nr:FAD-dependent oxidoreductase [Lachnospiraceae bacterium]
MNVFVIGGGFVAVEEGIFLTKYAKHVTMIVRSEDFSCAKTVSDKLIGNEKITVRFSTELIKVEGNRTMKKAVFRDRNSHEIWKYDAAEDGGFGVFVFAGYAPNTEWLPKVLQLNEQGYIVTDGNQKTNLDGVYAAGDVCVKNLRQVVTAVADGAIAATSLEHDVTKLHKKLSIPEFTVIVPEQKKNSNTGNAETNGNTMNSNDTNSADGVFLDNAVKSQLVPLFDKFQQPVCVRAWLGTDKVSEEVESFLEEFTQMTDKVSWERAEENVPEYLPAMEVINPDGGASGMIFHGVPGGHEINSFVIALYNAAGPGTAISSDEKEKIQKIKQNINMKMLVSLSCTICPELVMSAQKIALLSDKVTAEMFDLTHYPDLKDKYQVMSVPCMIINDDKVLFGKKNVEELLEILVK